MARRALSAAIEAPRAAGPQVRGVPFGTDAGPLSATGTPCVVFGPGDIAQAHTKDEWIDLDQVAQAAEAYFRIAVELGSNSQGRSEYWIDNPQTETVTVLRLRGDAL